MGTKEQIESLTESINWADWVKYAGTRSVDEIVKEIQDVIGYGMDTDIREIVTYMDNEFNRTYNQLVWNVDLSPGQVRRELFGEIDGIVNSGIAKLKQKVVDVVGKEMPGMYGKVRKILYDWLKEKAESKPGIGRSDVSKPSIRTKWLV